MRKITTVFFNSLVALGLISSVSAQTQSEINALKQAYTSNGLINDSKLVMDMMEKNHPGYKKQANKAFNQAKDLQEKSGNVHTINLVVHVVWSQPQENLDDSVILNQVKILNEDFMRTNADSNNLRAIFQNVAGNPKINFNLIAINRVNTTSTFNMDFFGGTLYNDIKHSNTGGSDAWNTANYLNIWVGKLEASLLGQIFGYAYPPAGLSNWPAGSTAPNADEDGVVIDYRVFGANNPNDMPHPSGSGNVNITGRTTVHEVGHYLGLRHTWGDGGGLTGGSSCHEDDGCADTPNQGAQSSFDCNPANNTCIDSIGGAPSPNDLPDLIENHMDYSDEGCKNMFTKDQIAIMRGVLAQQRNGIVQSVTGIEEKNGLSVNLYPNPTKGLINVSLKNVGANLTANVFNMLGDLITSKQLLNATSVLDLSSYNEGVYFVQFTSGKNVLNTERIILTK